MNLIVATAGAAASGVGGQADQPLVQLAAAKFPSLTTCERALLEYADIKNTKSTAPTDFAVCGPSSNPDDASNDPKQAYQWDHQRELRASLIRWLCVDPTAVKLIDPEGISVLGARIVGSLRLAGVHVPFGLALDHCAIPEPINLTNAELTYLDLGGSLTGNIFAANVHVFGDVFMWYGFHASGLVAMDSARIDGNLTCPGGSFAHSKDDDKGPYASYAFKSALILRNSRIGGWVMLCCGFRSEGAVMLESATAGELLFYGGRFINPGHLALLVDNANISTEVNLAIHPTPVETPGGIEVDGLALFSNARLGTNFNAIGAKFLGETNEMHGLSATSMAVGGVFLWQNVELQNGATLDLRSASVDGLLDDEKSWPQPGRLAIGGFTYRGIAPADASSRLRWINLDSGPHPPWIFYWRSGFQPQPYRQLAQVLRNGGDEAGARAVLIAEEDARYRGLGLPARIWGGFLKWTIGYGHQPLLAVFWMAAVVLMGWALVCLGTRAGVMRPTYPENTPPAATDPYEELYPFLYSLDVFLPFVNLHQEHYWWPNGQTTGQCAILGRSVPVSGSLLRYYLWFQIIAGWLLSAIFVAGVTGLVRGD